MFKLSNILKAVSIASILSVTLSGSVFAQQSSAAIGPESVGLEVSAPIYQYTIKPNSVQQDIIKIKNVGSSVKTYYPEVRDFKPLGETGAPNFLPAGQDNGTYSLEKWIKFSTEAVTLKPNESQAFNFNITVPANAEPGGHYGGILFSTKAPNVVGTGVGINSEVGSLILVRVAGTAKESLGIKEFTTDKTSYASADVNFSLRLENTGSVHLQPKGVVTIKNWFGGQIASLDVNQTGSNVLPGSIRKFDFNWKDPGFKIGYYTATVLVSYGSPTQTVTAQVGFWILPWKTILVLAVLLVLLIVALYFAIKRYNAWIIYKSTNNRQ